MPLKSLVLDESLPVHQLLSEAFSQHSAHISAVHEDKVDNMKEEETIEAEDFYRNIYSLVCIQTVQWVWGESFQMRWNMNNCAFLDRLHDDSSRPKSFAGRFIHSYQSLKLAPLLQGFKVIRSE